jgi:transposase
MDHISGTAREQITMFPEAVEDYLSPENPVRFLDAFVDSLEMRSLGFQHAIIHETGRPPYDPKDMLKLYLYGYLNRIRSSRLLERETTRNLEVFWLLKRIAVNLKEIVGCVLLGRKELKPMRRDDVRLSSENDYSKMGSIKRVNI